MILTSWAAHSVFGVLWTSPLHSILQQLQKEATSLWVPWGHQQETSAVLLMSAQAFWTWTAATFQMSWELAVLPIKASQKGEALTDQSQILAWHVQAFVISASFISWNNEVSLQKTRKGNSFSLVANYLSTLTTVKCKGETLTASSTTSGP